MGAERPGKSHATARALSIVAVAVLYLLSVPPLEICTEHQGTHPDWFYYYQRPLWWLASNTQLTQTLALYKDWWERVARP
jgi:hypothetical protein